MASGRTTLWPRSWSRRSESARSKFLGTETGSAAVLFGAAAAALVWANVDLSSYDRVWGTTIAVTVGGHGIRASAHDWVNSGLMTFFFLVVGLEARQEFDIGELRDRPRAVLPALAGIGGMAMAVLLFVAVNAGRPSAHEWGVAMSTDTAFALGALAVVGGRVPDRLRSFVLSVVVVDDIVALVVITTVYTTHVDVTALAVAIGLFAVVVGIRQLGVRAGLPYLVLGVAVWVALWDSGVDPLVVGLAMGLVTVASPAARVDLERATDLFRGFREQPTRELARAAATGVQTALSPNDRLQGLFHPWTSYLVVPLFALCNAGIALSGSFLVEGYTSAVTLGVLLAYVVGKPVGVVAVSALVTRLSRGRLRPLVGWLAVTGGGTLAGVPFTVSLLIASLAFHGLQRKEATLGVLTAAVVSTGLTWVVFRIAAALPARTRVLAMVGRAASLNDLTVPVDLGRDHVRGPADAPVTLVEYGDFECPYCGQAEPAVRELLADFGDLRYVWRHLPLSGVHPQAWVAAVASEAADRQGAFWPMHDLLLEHQDDLHPLALQRYAGELGLDVERFHQDVLDRVGADRIAEDQAGADESGVAGTPSFFVNGQRHRGAYDLVTLAQAVKKARVQAAIGGHGDPYTAVP